MLRGVEDGETPKQGPGGRRAAKQSGQNEAKGFRNLLIFRNDKTEREMEVKAAERRIIAAAIHALIGDK